MRELHRCVVNRLLAVSHVEFVIDFAQHRDAPETWRTSATQPGRLADHFFGFRFFLRGGLEEIPLAMLPLR